MLAYGFGQRALVGGLLIAATCSMMSFFVIVRRLAFAGMGISHAAFGGVAIGIAAGVNPIATAGVFCVGVAGAIGWLSRKGRLHEDTVIGILFSASMALGVVLIAAAHAYNQDLLSYLFGSILAMSWADVVIVGGPTHAHATVEDHSAGGARSRGPVQAPAGDRAGRNARRLM